ncbi:MAG: DUF4418 family protein [Candidatus Thorarchaeota archaeon]|jgi:hypothetical protein|nr:DUF4418 family protein [Candidatus Thorarchaeota archaeon]TET14629.1 MAG: DUF4418 family protein [Candidatus Thorarchaeota archaeon]
MKTEVILYLIILILGIVTAIAPWTFAPVCMTEMRCYFTRDVMTVLGAAISVVALLGMYKSME